MANAITQYPPPGIRRGQTLQAEDPYMLDQAKHFFYVFANDVKGKITIDTISSLFIGIILKYTTSWICPPIAAVMPDFIWFGLGAVVDRVKLVYELHIVSQRVRELECENANFYRQKQDDAYKIDTLEEENKQIEWLRQENETLAQQRTTAILGLAPSMIERDRLQRELERWMSNVDAAQNQNRELTCQLEEAITLKNSSDEKLIQALDELQTLRSRAETADGDREFSQRLYKMKEICSEPPGKRAKGAIEEQMQAMKPLISMFEERREKLHISLEAAMKELPPDEFSTQLVLKQILRMSKEEVGIVREIGQLAQLFPYTNLSSQEAS